MSRPATIAGLMAAALCGLLATTGAAQAARMHERDERPRPATAFTVRAAPARSARGSLAPLAVNPLSTPAPPEAPFTQCPAVGADLSCELLIDVTDAGTVVLQDPTVGPYDSIEDTLIGVYNRSSKTIAHLSLSSNTDLFGFDGDGICTFGLAGCPFGPTGYEGPGTSFSNISSDASGGQVDFTGGLAPGATAYFSLEEALQATSVVTGGPRVGEQGAAKNRAEHSTTCSTAQPVNCATGTFWHTFTDVHVPGNGVPLDLTRTYSAAAAAVDGPFGFGWTDAYAMHLGTDQSGNVTVVQEDGSEVTFAPNGGGGFSAAPRVLASLVDDGDGTYTFTRNADHVQHVFDATSGALLRQVDRNGYTTTLAYAGGHLDTVTDAAGRTLSFTYAGDRVASVTDPAGKAWRYDYDADGNLSTATDPLGRSWSFTYDAAHLLLSMTDPRGGSTTNAYDGSSRVATQTDPLGGVTTWAYNGDNASPAGGSTDVTDPRGHVTHYEYAELELASVTRAYGTAAAATTSFQYDAATLGVTVRTDPNGGVTTHSYDHDGNLLATTDPLGRFTFYTYDALDELTSRTDPTFTTTSYEYDEHGNLLLVTTPISTGGSADHAFAYGSGATAGDVIGSTDPNGNTTTYAYDAAGDRTSTTDPLGRHTSAAYDADGRLLSRTSPNGGQTTFAYDDAGEPTHTIDPLGHTTSWTYDGNGNRTAVTDANGHTTHFTYDAGDRQTKIERPGGTTLRTEYDANGNVLKQIDGNGHETTYAWDALDRVATTTDPNGHTTSYEYDGEGNLLVRTDPSGASTTYTYDAADELTHVDYSDPATPDVSTAYDADRRRVSRTDGSGTTTYLYDSLGRLLFAQDGAGASSSYEYDAAGHVTAITYPNGQTVHRSYDAAGQLTSVSDWLGHVTQFAYDDDGNLVNEQLPGSVTARSAYDAADRLTSIADARGATALAGFDYSRDAVGDLTGSTATGTVSGTDSYGYDADGRLATAGGDTYAYDAGDNATGYVGGAPQTFDAANQLQASGVDSGPGPDPGPGPEPRPGPGPGPAPSPGPGGGSSSGGGGGSTGGGGGSSGGGGASVAKVAIGGFAATHRIHRHRTLTTRLTTRQSGDLVLAFVSAQGPAGGGQAAGTPSGGGLSWTLLTREGSRGATVSVWQAHAAGPLSRAAITTRLRRRSSRALLSIVAFAPGAQVGAHAIATGTFSSPKLALRAPAGAQVWEVGSQDRGGAAGAAWARHVATSAAGSIAVAGQAPKLSKSWSLAAVVVQPSGATAARAGGAAGTSSATPSSTAATTVRRTFAYDADGDRIGVTAGSARTDLGYDQAHRLTSVTGGIGYAYDGDGLRTNKTVGGTTTRFAWDPSGSLPLLLQDGGTSYVYGPGGQAIEQITGGAATFLLADQQGSTTLLTDGAGTVTGTYRYDAWGNVTSHTGSARTNLQYDGEYTDAETGFQYLRARYYDPSTGQFLSVDPLVTLTRNRFGYAANSPLNESDPTGSWSLSNMIGQAWIDSGAYNFFATHTVGVCLSGSASFYAYGSASGCVGLDGGYDAVSYSVTGGAGTGASLSGSVSGVYSNVVDTDSGGSWSATQGGSVGEGISVGLDASEGPGPCGTIGYSIQPSIGIGVNFTLPAEPGELHTGATYTYTEIYR